MAYRICTKCKIHHYENCSACFGFGVVRSVHHIDKLIPISANEAYMIIDAASEFNMQWLHCPECNSTPYGIPKKEIT